MYAFVFSALIALGTAGQNKTLAIPDGPRAIQEAMAQQVNCWNNGNLECFMQSYWQSDSLVFIGKSGLKYGWQTTLNNYKKGYPNKETMGTLAFDILSIQRTGPKTCFVIGKWHLKRQIGNIGGHYTLLWRYINKKWVIVADHSS